MPSVDESIEVDAPIDEVYRRWTDFEQFPRFMENVKEVRRTGPDRTHWVAEVAGQRLEWDAETTVQDRERVAWKARGDAGQSGVVTFDDLGGRTRINVHIDYALDSRMQEAAARAFGIDESVVKGDLERFRETLEEGGPTRL